MDTPSIDRTAWQPLITCFLDRNSKINLSAIRDADGVREKHILDSLELTKVYQIPTWATCLDLGTGGGFPLLPLAMTHPAVKFTGIDARKKKVEVVNQMIASLGVSNVRALRGRIEEHHDRYDMVVSRAVAYADQLFSRAIPHLKPWGVLSCYKLFTPEEDHLIITLMRQYQLQMIALHHYRLPHDQLEIQRVLYVMKRL